MPVIIKVTVKNREMKRTVNALKGAGRLPAMSSEAMMEWGTTLERDMKTAARQAGIQNFTGTLMHGKGIEWRQRPKGYIGRLFMRKYGIYLDSMRNHWVNMKRSRRVLLKWAQQADDPKLRSAARKISAGKARKYAFGVRKHPFIRMGFERARPKLAPIIKTKAKQAMMGG